MTQIQLRRDTAANWASANPTLASGEPAFETDTGKFKIGDGVTAYNSLDYIGEGDLPSNMVTTDTSQTINGQKEFKETILSLDNDLIRGQQSEAYRNGAGLSMGSNSTSTDGGAFAPQWIIYDTTGAAERLETIITTYNQSVLNNTNFNAASKLVRLDSSGKLPAIDGSQLTGISAGSNSLNAIVMEQNNFNNYIKAGVYYWSSYTTPVNHPNGNYKGMLQVFVQEDGNSPVVQIFTLGEALGTDTPPGMWIRYCNSGRGTGYQWSSWLKVNGGDAPTNMVTTDTEQTITGTKTFDNDTVFNGRIRMDNDSQTALDLTVSNRITVGASSASNLNQIFLNANEVRVSSGNLTNALNSHIIQKTDTTITIGDSGDTIVNGNNKKILDEENFATLAPTGALKYWTGTEEAYTGLSTKDADTLYRTTDTNKVYLGTIQIGGGS